MTTRTTATPRKAAPAKRVTKTAVKKTTSAPAPKKRQARTRTPMSDEHKQALATGREEGRSVRLYLEALDKHKPRRGRKRTPESMTRRIESIDSQLGNASGLDRLHLLQERMDIQQALAKASEVTDLKEFEDAFVAHAKTYGDRKGISPTIWRTFGVPRDVLKRAGIV